MKSLYQFWNKFSYTFTFTRRGLWLENTDHPNLKFEINAKNPSKEKKQIFESSNLIYDSTDEVAASKILGDEGQKATKVVKKIDLTTISFIYKVFFLYDFEKYICKTCVTETEK